MRMYDIIHKKREGGELTTYEIHFFVQGYTQGEIPDYQASALLMAIFFRGMTQRETAALTLEMARSGDMVDLSSIPGVKVDKHSTGGVGDKTSLILGPIAAACGVKIAKMSGRGLGHTGGTVDKLESIPGLRTDIPRQEFFRIVQEVGLSIIGVGGLRGVADVRGVLFGLGAAAFYAAVILLNKFIRSVAGIQRTFLQFLAAIVILIPYVAATGGVSLGTLDARGWVCLLIVGFFHTGVTYCLYFSALRELPGQEVALLSYMDPLVAVIVSVTVLGEPVTAPQLAGGALILGFTLWNELSEKK